MGRLPRIDSLLAAAHALGANDLAIVDDFLPAALARPILDEVKRMAREGVLRPAQVGRQGEHRHDDAIRGDHIRWLTPHQAAPALLPFFVELKRLQQTVNRVLFMGLWRLECHATHYPPGAAYQRHFDAFAGEGRSRQVSFVYYLVEDWAAPAGGLLRVHTPAAEDIAPLFGRLVMFRSDTVEHEVTEVGRDRFSLTGWWSPRDLSPQAALRNTLDALRPPPEVEPER